MSDNQRDNKFTFDKLCLPAKVYTVISFISIIQMIFRGKFYAAVVKIIFSVIWVFVLDWICRQGWTNLSWVLVFLPIVIYTIMTIAAFSFAAGAKYKLPNKGRSLHSR